MIRERKGQHLPDADESALLETTTPTTSSSSVAQPPSKKLPAQQLSSKTKPKRRAKLEQHSNSLEDRLDELEQYSWHNCLLVHGLDEQGDETPISL